MVNGRVLGIDPGSRVTGFGVIDIKNGKLSYVDSGCIRLPDESITVRLQHIFNGIEAVIQQYQPTLAAIEQVFMHQNPGAALKLGQARGAAIVSITRFHVPVSEYSARQIKQAVAGYGAADKEQIQAMVCRLLSLSGVPQADAADALAVAICHAHTKDSLRNVSGVHKTRQGRWHHD